MGIARSPEDAGRLEAAQFPVNIDEATEENPEPWELIDAEAGRYMPRRIRGSFRGRALG